jgi:DNA-binding transcriptional ArsR family regulator
MRPVAVTQNPLRYPLNELLGTATKVRILRTLAEHEEPLSVKELSERTDITPPGVHQALKRLRQTGFVVIVGGAHAQRHTLRWTDPLLQSLIELFTTERRRYEDLLEGIRGVFYRTSPPPISASINRLPDRVETSLEISLLGDAESLTDSVQNLRNALTDIEQQFDITIELHGYTRADLPAVDSITHIYLAGAPVSDDRGSKPGAHHRRKDLEASRLSHAIADLIRRDPSLVSRARRHVEQVLQTQRGPASHDLEEWRNILETYSLNRLRGFLSSAGERSVRLRQSSPFSVVLTEKEREWISGQVQTNDT